MRNSIVHVDDAANADGLLRMSEGESVRGGGISQRALGSALEEH